MKNKVLLIISIVLLITLLGVSTTFAQDNNEEDLKGLPLGVEIGFGPSGSMHIIEGELYLSAGPVFSCNFYFTDNMSVGLSTGLFLGSYTFSTASYVINMPMTVLPVNMYYNIDIGLGNDKLALPMLFGIGLKLYSLHIPDKYVEIGAEPPVISSKNIQNAISFDIFASFGIKVYITQRFSFKALINLDLGFGIIGEDTDDYISFNLGLVTFTPNLELSFGYRF